MHFVTDLPLASYADRKLTLTRLSGGGVLLTTSDRVELAISRGVAGLIWEASHAPGQWLTDGNRHVRARGDGRAVPEEEERPEEARHLPCDPPEERPDNAPLRGGDGRRAYLVALIDKAGGQSCDAEAIADALISEGALL